MCTSQLQSPKISFHIPIQKVTCDYLVIQTPDPPQIS